MQLDTLELKISITLKKIIEITKGSFAGQLESLDQKISSITINSRDAGQFDLYIAVIGKNHDGNKFTTEVLNNGTKFAIVSNPLFHREKTILVKNGKEALGNIALYLRDQIKPKIIAITGSNGKTTTASLLYHILKNAGLNVGVGGNIGDSFALQVAKCDYEYYVLELSSFQLDGIESLKLDVSILLNITPDHLDRYEYSLDKYIDSKFQIIKNIDENTVFIYSNDDENIANRLPSVTLPSSSYSFSINELGSEFARVKDSEIIIDINNPLRISVDSTSLKGKHNSYNIMASVTAASVLGIQESQILVAVETFQPIEHRMERVVVLNDVEYINDSKATNVDSTFYALDSIEDNVIWIAGGVDKGNDYSQLIPLVISKVHGMICLGKDNQKLHATFGGFVKRIENAKNADEAVKKASAMAGKGFTVLLSPACASFDLFKNYEDRGLKFKQAITKLTK